MRRPRLRRLAARSSGAAAPEKPVLAVDIDGVVLLLGREEATGPTAVEVALIDGMMHYVSMEAGERLRMLGASFDILWASGWEDRSLAVGRHMALPDFPYLSFGGAARFGTAHWKTGALESYSDGRPLAWVDDSLDPRCHEWARTRADPTLLIEVEPHLGLQDAHVETLMSWARGLEAEGG